MISLMNTFLLSRLTPSNLLETSLLTCLLLVTIKSQELSMFQTSRKITLSEGTSPIGARGGFTSLKPLMLSMVVEILGVEGCGLVEDGVEILLWRASRFREVKILDEGCAWGIGNDMTSAFTLAEDETDQGFPVAPNIEVACG